MDKATTKRNGAIDFLRFLFALVIIIYHARGIGGGSDHALFKRFGYIGVEFFFIVSGFLMAKSAERDSELESTRSGGVCLLGEDTVRFLWRKIKTVLPYFLLAAIPSLVVLFYDKGYGRMETLERLMMCVWDLSFLGASGIKTYTVVRASWYLSAMYISMILLYPLLRKFKDQFTHIIAPLLSIVLLGYISQTFGHLDQYIASDAYTVVHSGILRAIAELSLGCICYAVCKEIRRKPLTQLSRVLISVICVIGFTGVFLATNVNRKYFDFVLLFAIVVCTTLVFSELGAISRSSLFKHKVFPLLGELSMVVYLNHMWIKTFITTLIPKSHGYSILLCIYVISVVVISFLMMGIVYCLKKFWKSKGKHIKSWFIIPDVKESENG